MRDSQQAAQEIARRAAERFERVDRYLERVAALPASAWGRLDAAGQRLDARDPIARWQRARYAAHGPMPAFRRPMIAFVLGIEVVSAVVHALDGEKAVAHWFTARGAPTQPRSAEGERMRAQMRRLHEITAAKPGGPGAAVGCLVMGLVALQSSRIHSDDSFMGLYSLVEPVIPLATL